MRRTRAKKLIVRRIQSWLAKYEYESGYGILLHRCQTPGFALCRTGVVVAESHSCYVDPWINYTTKQLNILFNEAKRDQAGCKVTKALK